MSVAVGKGLDGENAPSYCREGLVDFIEMLTRQRPAVSGPAWALPQETAVMTAYFSRSPATDGALVQILTRELLRRAITRSAEVLVDYAERQV